MGFPWCYFDLLKPFEKLEQGARDRHSFRGGQFAACEDSGDLNRTTETWILSGIILKADQHSTKVFAFWTVDNFGQENTDIPPCRSYLDLWKRSLWTERERRADIKKNSGNSNVAKDFGQQQKNIKQHDWRFWSSQNRGRHIYSQSMNYSRPFWRLWIEEDIHVLV